MKTFYESYYLNVDDYFAMISASYNADDDAYIHEIDVLKDGKLIVSDIKRLNYLIPRDDMKMYVKVLIKQYSN